MQSYEQVDTPYSTRPARTKRTRAWAFTTVTILLLIGLPLLIISSLYYEGLRTIVGESATSIITIAGAALIVLSLVVAFVLASTTPRDETYYLQRDQ